MIRTAFAATLAALGLATAVEAHPPQPGYFPQAPIAYRPAYYPPAPVVGRRPIQRLYEVEYRRHSRDCWQTYRVTPDHRYAHDLVRDLRRQGFQARVDH